VFTATEDKPLREILKAIFEKQEGKPAVDAKSDDKVLKAFFLEVVPDYDTERVYISDIRKIINWYNLLQEHNLLDFTEKEEEQPEDKKEEIGTAEEIKAEKPVPKKKKPAEKKTEGKETAAKKKEPAEKKKAATEKKKEPTAKKKTK
jgi:hypothetical protein